MSRRKERVTCNFHREPCAGHREVSGEASAAACMGQAFGASLQVPASPLRHEAPRAVDGKPRIRPFVDDHRTILSCLWMDSSHVQVVKDTGFSVENIGNSEATGTKEICMGHLYWSCLQEAQEELLYLVAENGCKASVVGSSNGIPIIVVSGSDMKVLRLTLDLIAQQRITSAAIMSVPLLEDNLWFAAEWSGCLVVECAEISGIASELSWLQPEGEEAERNLVIFRVPEKITSSPEEANGFTQEGEVSALVRELPHKYYGNLADPLVGGASALYAAGFEAARARDLPEDRIVVASPEALGFELDNRNNSVVAWQKKSVISVEAVGFGRGSIEEVFRLFADHEVDVVRDDLERKFDDWRLEGLDLAVGLVLRGHEDPPVVIPVGSVYQQPSIGSQAQNLAIAKPASPMVAAGATVPLILPAWCLNQTFSEPKGPVVPTPLIATSAGGTQRDVWERINNRYRRSL